MATVKRGRKPKEASKTDSLLKALRFIALAQSDVGTVLQRHCVIHSGWIAATNNVITLGVKVADDLSACPQTKRLIAALERCGDGVAIAQQDADRLRVVSGGLRVSVPCVPLADMHLVWADQLIAPLDSRFVDGLREIGPIANEKAGIVQYASVLCAGQSMAATTGEVIAEHWHGCETPPYWVLPAATVEALLKVDKQLTGFGFSGHSATFYFEDESWLRTQLYEDKWPNAEKVWASFNPNAMEAIPPTLFDAAATLLVFAEGGFAYLQEGKLLLENQLTDAAEQDVPGLKAGPTVKLKNLLLLKHIAKSMGYSKGDRAMFFAGDKTRMALAIAVSKHDPNEMHDDIPF